MLEQVFAANPALEEAFDLGVDVALGTVCWGAFLNGPGLATLPCSVAGLSDESTSWLVGFRRLIVAAGARDLVYFFDGADQPGVMGAQAFHALLHSYDAFDGRRIVILGSGDLAIAAAEDAIAKGLEIAAIVEAGPHLQGNPARVSALGVPVFTGHVIKSAARGPYGVAGVALVPSAGGAAREIACDTVVLAVGRVPVVELLDVAGAKLVMDGARGGFVAASPDGNSTSVAGVFVAGDAAGAGRELAGPESAAASGRRAAQLAARSLGKDVPLDHPVPWPLGEDQLPYRLGWMRALLATGGDAPLACQCEEVTRADLLEVRAPRYLGSPTEKSLCRDLTTIAADGPVNHDQMKRLTRVSMGACQGRRCREQVAMLMAIGAATSLESIPLAGYRAPVRPLTLAALASLEESEDSLKNWVVWFRIRTQWIPYDAIGTEREQDLLDSAMHL